MLVVKPGGEFWKNRMVTEQDKVCLLRHLCPANNATFCKFAVLKMHKQNHAKESVFRNNENQ